MGHYPVNKKEIASIALLVAVSTFVLYLILGAIANAQTGAITAITDAAGAQSSPQTTLEKTIASLINLFPAIVVVAIIGLIGTIYKTRSDRGLGTEQNITKVLETVLRDNSTLKAESQKLTSDLHERNLECIDLTKKTKEMAVEIIIKDSTIDKITKEAADRKERYEKLRAEFADTLVVKIKNSKASKKLLSLGISQAELELLILEDREEAIRGDE